MSQHKYIAVRNGYFGDNWIGYVKPVGLIQEGQTVILGGTLEQVFGKRPDGTPKCDWLKPAESAPALDSDKPLMPKMDTPDPRQLGHGEVPPVPSSPSYDAGMHDIKKVEGIQDGVNPVATPAPATPQAPQLAATNDPTQTVGNQGAAPAAPAAPVPQVDPAPAAPAVTPETNATGGASEGTGNQDVLGQ